MKNIRLLNSDIKISIFSAKTIFSCDSVMQEMQNLGILCNILTSFICNHQQNQYNMM